ncbi:MAG TPA: hypothetical protein VGL40_03615, partial [Bacillota bacterium]
MAGALQVADVARIIPTLAPVVTPEEEARNVASLKVYRLPPEDIQARYGRPGRVLRPALMNPLPVESRPEEARAVTRKAMGEQELLAIAAQVVDGETVESMLRR